jgi:hypothetical protein
MGGLNSQPTGARELSYRFRFSGFELLGLPGRGVVLSVPVFAPLPVVPDLPEFVVVLELP